MDIMARDYIMDIMARYDEFKTKYAMPFLSINNKLFKTNGEVGEFIRKGERFDKITGNYFSKRLSFMHSLKDYSKEDLLTLTYQLIQDKYQCFGLTLIDGDRDDVETDGI